MKTRGSKSLELRGWPHDKCHYQKRSVLEPSPHGDHLGDFRRAVMSVSTDNADLLVLESDWGEDLADNTSTRPFLEGLAAALDITIVFRTFHSARDLTHWLRQMFKAKRRPSIAYISSHGDGRFLQASLGDSGIDLRRVLVAATKGTRQKHGRRGLLLGACEIGRDLDEVLASARGRLDWVAGYAVEVPWIESTLIDLAFLSYVISGRRVRAANGKCVLRRQLQSERTGLSEKAAAWVGHDFGVAHALRFRAKDWRPTRAPRRSPTHLDKLSAPPPRSPRVSHRGVSKAGPSGPRVPYPR